MHLAAFLLAFIIPIRYAWALNINFYPPPIGAHNNTFLWMKEQGDPEKVWLRKQKLDDPTGATVWSDDLVQLDLSRLKNGSSGIHFNRAGLFGVGVFKTDGNPRFELAKGKLVLPISTTQVTVSLNPTSAGAIPMSTTPPFMSSNMSSNSNPGPGEKGPTGEKVALVVGLTLGFATLLVIIAATILYFRYRRRRMPDTMPIPSWIREMDNESYTSFEKCDSPPPIQTIYSIPTEGSFSVTSPIAAAARDRERKRNKFLRLSFTTITSGVSRSTNTRNSHVSDSSDFPLPALPPRTRTDRQMLIEQKIQLLQSKMIILQGRSGGRLTPQTSFRPLPPLPPPSPGSPARLPTTPTPLTPALAGDEQEELEKLKKTIEKMKQLHESDWAVGLTNVAPEGLHD